MKVTVEKITPEMAEAYLIGNMVNRRVAVYRVNAYANDIKRGAWQLNGEAIKFNKQGKLIDGQHRLLAIIKSGIPVDIVVMRDIDNDISIYDRGRNRSVTDSLIIDGVDRKVASNTWVAVAKLHYFIQKGQFNVSDYDVKLFLTKYENEIIVLNEAITRKNGGVKSGRISNASAPSVLAMFYAYMSKEPFESIKRFSEVYSTGFYSNNSETSAIVLRNDAISGSVPLRGGTPERKRVCFQFEKAISDFCKGYPRKISYSSWDKPVYSNNIIFKEN